VRNRSEEESSLHHLVDQVLILMNSFASFVGLNWFRLTTSETFKDRMVSEIYPCTDQKVGQNPGKGEKCDQADPNYFCSGWETLAEDTGVRAKKH